MLTKSEKPPRGPVPKNIRILERAEELSKALYEYIIFYEDKKLKMITLKAMQSWAEELVDTLDELEEYADV